MVPFTNRSDGLRVITDAYGVQQSIRPGETRNIRVSPAVIELYKRANANGTDFGLKMGEGKATIARPKLLPKSERGPRKDFLPRMLGRTGGPSVKIEARADAALAIIRQADDLSLNQMYQHATPILGAEFISKRPNINELFDALRKVASEEPTAAPTKKAPRKKAAPSSSQEPEEGSEEEPEGDEDDGTGE